LLCPLRFHPFLRPMVWGGRKLGEVLHKPLDSNQAYGESWEVSDHPLHESVVATGPAAGKTLRQLMEENRDDLLGSPAQRYQKFPWLIKFLDAKDWLSVQVHPDENAVAKLWPGEGSKTEAWFVLDAAPGSRIYAGLRPGVDEKKLRAALATGKVTECLHDFEPQPGDCVFLPAGTVHAVGGGVLMAEIQQTSDATFRLFDWNRRDAQGKSRPLHIEQSMASIHWDQGPVQPTRVSDFEKDAKDPKRQNLVQCPYFSLEFMRAVSPPSLGGDRRLRAIIILEGQGRWAVSGFTEPVHSGEVWVLPASLSSFPCRPEPALSMLVCSLP
jgi:mannose-6-phosphate isomerase